MANDQINDLLERISEQSDYAIVGPHDSRVQEVNTTRFPFNTVCHLGRDFGDGKLSGCSGTLVAPRVVLTAAHCLYSHSPARRGAPRTIWVTPGRRDRRTMPFRSIPSRRFYVPEGFIRPVGGTQRNFDYGIVILPRAFAGINRFMPVKRLSDAALRQLITRGMLTISGYPADRPLGTMWRHAEKLRRFNADRLFYSVDTCPGHSGSAIWIGGATQPAIIGIHTTGILDSEGRPYGCKPGTVLAPAGQTNSGVRLTAAVTRAILDPEDAGIGTRRMRRLPD